MKKLYLFLLLFLTGTFSATFTSCDSDDDGNGPVIVPANSFAYNRSVQPFASILYVYDEVEGIYTFYFSPSEGITDLDDMWQANDYIRIITPMPAGDVNLLEEGNELSYNELIVSPATAENMVQNSLSLRLPKLSEVKMSLKVETADGQTLDANYSGTCIRITKEREQGPAVELDTPMFSWYIGKSSAGTNNIYMAMGNAPYSIYLGTQFSYKEDADALVLDCFIDSGDEWQTFPTGTFKSSVRYGDHTFHASNSYVLRYEGGSYTQFPITSDVVIEREGNITTITTAYVDGYGVEHEVTFTGDLRVGNGLSMPQNAHLMRDIDFVGYYGEGTYHGDLFKCGSGISEVTIYNEASDNNEPDSYAVNLVLFSTKFLDPKNERKLVEDEYVYSESYEQGTWMPTAELEVLGVIFPFGTYGVFADGSSQTGFYSYATGGTINIKELGNTDYEITFDLVAQSGYNIKGSFTGDIFLTDASNDDENDGSSTLTEDLHLDVDYIQQARCYPQTEIYVAGMGYIPVDEITTIAQPAAIAPCGYQYIDIGLATGTYEHDPTGEYVDPGKLHEGDIIRLDLLVEPGDQDKITTGTYTITRNRYLNTLQPGACYRGYQATDHIGTRWLYISSAIGNGKPRYYHDPNYMVQNDWLNIPSMTGYASLYEGTVTITKADGGDNWYTFEINGEDVLHHKITGSWTGPVVLGGSDTPVADSGKHFDEEDSASSGAIDGGSTTQRKLRKKPIENLREYVTKPVESQPFKRAEFR